MTLPQQNPCLTTSPEAEIDGVGDTGLTAQQEFDNRERKMSVNGVDIRKFGMRADGGWHPANDPYYGRKSVSSESRSAQTHL